MDILGIMKKAQAMQSKLAETQEELGRIEVEGESGGGLVKVTLTAKGDLKAVKLDPSLMKPDEARWPKISSSPPSPTPRARPSASRPRRCRR